MVVYCKTITLSCELTRFSLVFLYTASGQKRQSFLVVAQVLNLVRFHLFFYRTVGSTNGTQWWVGECLVLTFNFLKHPNLHPLFNSVTLSTLTVHCQREDETA